jgi:hypothetical protein
MTVTKMNSDLLITKVMALRTARGFKLTWFIPSEGRNFTAFAKNEGQKQAWLSDAQARGWQLVQAPLDVKPE